MSSFNLTDREREVILTALYDLIEAATNSEALDEADDEVRQTWLDDAATAQALILRLR
jgi:hypothetical protein